MKSSEKSARPGAGKQKKQMMALGGLVAVFGAVLAIQFGGGGAAPAAAAMTAPTPDPANAVVISGSETTAAAPSAPSLPVAKDNPVLAEAVGDTAIKRSPFSNFWSVTPTTSRSTAPTLNAPNITLNATMPSEVRGIAVIDGTLRFVGDSIQGWSLASVGPRSVTLQAPAGETVVVDMPLLVGRLAVPADDAPGDLAGDAPLQAPFVAPSGG